MRAIATTNMEHKHERLQYLQQACPKKDIISGAVLIFTLLATCQQSMMVYGQVPGSCNLNESLCENGRCINSSSVCNYYNDCGDNSDEFGCSTVYGNYCSHNQYRCDGRNYYYYWYDGTWGCINSTLACNGELDCSFGTSDEQGCDCSNYHCANGLCVSNSSRCNGENDCGDGSDEYSCGSCNSNDFLCKNGRCVSSSSVCNYYNDCGDNSDEFGCSTVYGYYCTHNQYRCDGRNYNYYWYDGTWGCINATFACNGELDCRFHRSDEQGCGSCNSTDILCKNGRCVNSSSVCNYYNDCGDNSDEFGCRTVYGYYCTHNQYRCDLRNYYYDYYWNYNDGTWGCINSTLVCNGELDCRFDRSDEQGCDSLYLPNGVHTQMCQAHQIY